MQIWKKNQLNGDYLIYNEDENLKSKAHLKNGKFDSPWIIYTYDKSGKLWYDNSFRVKGDIFFSDLTKDIKLIKECEFHFVLSFGKSETGGSFKDDYIVSITECKENGSSFKIGETINGKFKVEYTYYDEKGTLTHIDTYNEGVKVSSRKVK